jgi:hypothetical protein
MPDMDGTAEFGWGLERPRKTVPYFITHELWSLLGLIRPLKIDGKIESKHVFWFFCNKISDVHHIQLAWI